jgi:hypothetical protein
MRVFDAGIKMRPSSARLGGTERFAKQISLLALA